MRKLIPPIAGTVLTVAFELSIVKGWFESVPDSIVALFWFIPVLLWIYWLYTHEEVKRRRHFLYARPMITLSMFVIGGGILGASSGALGWWSLKKQHEHQRSKTPVLTPTSEQPSSTSTKPIAAETPKISTPNLSPRPQLQHPARRIPAPAPPEQISHPVIGLMRTSVTKDTNSHLLTIIVTLQNASSFETTAHVSLISSWNDVPIHPITEPRDYGFAAQAWLELRVPLYLSLQDETAFLNGTGTLRIRLTAEYPDRGSKTVYLLEGRVDPNLDTIDITRGTWSH